MPALVNAPAQFRALRGKSGYNSLFARSALCRPPCLSDPTMNEIWHQNFDPVSNPVLSTIAAAIPVCTLFYFLAVRRTPAWLAAVYSFAVGIAVALGIFHMPAHMAAGAVADGLVYGWLRIAWILVAAVFVYDISVETHQFEIIKQSIGGISADRRLQVLLIAFAFGALL